MQLIYLSPHYDDICFSLGNLVSRMRTGTMINIYTRTNYATKKIVQKYNENELVEKITALRQQEDNLFAQKYNLKKIDLGLDDTVLSGDPFDTENINADLEQLKKILLPCLLKLLKPTDPSIVLCPLAIGNHRNHFVIFSFISQHINELEKHGGKVCFYEDLPYSSRVKKRKNGIKQKEEFLKSNQYRRYSYLLDTASADAKLKDVQIYKSQHESDEEIEITQYTPAIYGSRIAIHEAIWSKAKDIPALLGMRDNRLKFFYYIALKKLRRLKSRLSGFFV